jgi:hypothetical protein
LSVPDNHTGAGSAGDRFWLLHELARDHPLRRQPLGMLAAQCRNRHSKEWRDVARWRIASCAFDDLGEAWTTTSEFRVRAH